MDEEDLINIDTSQYEFPNTLWHVKPAKEIAIKTTAMLIIGVSGIFMNSIILIVLIRNKWLWNASNYLIGNLALIDFLTLLVCPWFMLVRDFYQQYVLKTFGCQFEGFLQATLLLASVGAVMLVSYDRLAAAALSADARVTRSMAPKAIFCTWFVAIVLSLPWILSREYTERQWLDYLETYCVEDVKVLGIYWHFTLSFLVWIPLGLMVLTYGTILWRLECSARELSKRGSGQAVTKARGRALRITACVLMAAVVCRLPYTVLIYWRNNLSNDINSYGTILWRLEYSARELSKRGSGQAVTKARARALRITACVLMAAVVCRLPYTVLIYWRNKLSNDINSYGTILWRLEYSARELSKRGSGQAVTKARARALRITACVLMAAVICRLPYTVLIYWRNKLSNDINSYGTILWRLEYSARELSKRGSGQAVTKARARALRITAACVLMAAVVCRLPYTVLIYWRNKLSNDINSVEGSYDSMWFVANYLMYLNCAVNPLIYGFTNTRLRKAMDRTPGVACWKFGSWCCVCSMLQRKHIGDGDKHTDKIFVIEGTPRPNKKLSHVIKNILHINKETLEFSIKNDDITTKPTRVTPVNLGTD